MTPGALPPIAARTISNAFERARDECPSKEFLRYQGKSWTFEQTFEEALAIGQGIRELVERPQVPIAFLLDNSSDFVFAWMGVALQRLIEVPINTALRGRFLAHVLNDSAAEVLVVEEHYVERILAVADQLSSLRTIVVRNSTQGTPTNTTLDFRRYDEIRVAKPALPGACKPDDIIGYMYTSGTTGPSKGVKSSQVHAYTYCSQEDSYEPTADECILVTLPLFHLAGQWAGVYGCLISRVTCVLEPGFSVSRFWNVVNDNKVTRTVLLGAQAEMLQQQAPTAGDSENTLLEAAMAPLPTNAEAFCRRFGVQAKPVYGMSEVGSVLRGEDPDDVRPGEAGKRRPSYLLKVVGDDGREVAPNTPGELLVKPEHPLMVMSGYHNLPEKTADMIDQDGWVHTGDIFKVDVDGHFYFLDRAKDALRRRGENISSFEVETTINEHPQVLESAVVGVDSELSEQEIKAFIVLREGQSLDPIELIRFLVPRMPYFTVPRYIEIVDELPKTPTHKVQKVELRARGVGGSTWDLNETGFRVKREGLVQLTSK
ncbi:ATP-dependent acyl-CoA ligase [Brevibacterium daeguense]|uniref:ATP-dependent acyl-CoA ligase n=1 Tax=Brevibacterium daeguense TaxID=909936 RepID=A0ABP8EFQ5_9MICO|nr:AMP-binding protein [Brevibacterium daeguense]